MVDAASTEGRDPWMIFTRSTQSWKLTIRISPHGPRSLRPTIDALYGGEAETLDRLKAEFEPKGIRVFPISAVSGKGLDELLYHVRTMLDQLDDTPVTFAQEYFPEEMLAVEVFRIRLAGMKGTSMSSLWKAPRLRNCWSYTNLDSEKGFRFFQIS